MPLFTISPSTTHPSNKYWSTYANYKTYNSIRGGRRGNDQSRAQRQTQNSRDGTPNSLQGRKPAGKGPIPSKQNEAIPNGPPGSDAPPTGDAPPLNSVGAVSADTSTNKSSSSRPMLYKPAQPAQKPDQPWGAKRETTCCLFLWHICWLTHKAWAMSNGKDFFLELRKQVTLLQQSGGTSQGGWSRMMERWVETQGSRVFIWKCPANMTAGEYCINGVRKDMRYPTRQYCQMFTCTESSMHSIKIRQLIFSRFFLNSPALSTGTQLQSQFWMVSSRAKFLTTPSRGWGSVTIGALLLMGRVNMDKLRNPSNISHRKEIGHRVANSISSDCGVDSKCH